MDNRSQAFMGSNRSNEFREPRVPIHKKKSMRNVNNSMRISNDKPLPDDKTFDPYHDQKNTRNRQQNSGTSKSNDSFGFHKRDETSEDPKQKMSKSFFMESRASINKFGKPPKTVVQRKSIHKKQQLTENESESKAEF